MAEEKKVEMEKAEVKGDQAIFDLETNKLLQDLSLENKQKIVKQVSITIESFKTKAATNPYLFVTEIAPQVMEFAETFSGAKSGVKLEIASYVTSSVMKALGLEPVIPTFFDTVVGKIIDATKGKFEINKKDVETAVSCCMWMRSKC